MSQPIPQLKCISQATAEREGYAEITTPIHPRTEADIFRNLERQLAGVQGVWIQHPNGTFSAARRKRDLLPIETLVSSDDRREDFPPTTRSKVSADILLETLTEAAKEDAL